MSTRHLCDYSSGSCRLPGVHGGVPDPDPADARVEDFTVGGGYDGETSLRCPHYARGCSWEVDFDYDTGDTLGALLVTAREHLATAHRLTVDSTVVTAPRALPGNVTPAP